MSLGYNSNRPVRGYGTVNSINNLNAPVSAVSKKKNTPQTIVSSGPTQNVQTTTPTFSSHTLNKVMTIQDNAIFQRRIEYLETQLKKTQMEFSDYMTKFQDFKTDSKSDPNFSGSMYEVLATAEKDIIGIETGEKIYKKGDTVHLVYPMKKDGTKTIMRAVRVDPVTAQFSYSWIVVFDMQSGKASRPVTNFRLS